MDFDRLRYLAALDRTGSMRRAAAALAVSPGAVSKGIARLEEEAGVPLLVPDGRGVVLTEEGRWLASRAQHLVGEFASLGADLATRRSREPSLCIATYDVFAAHLPGLLARQFLPDQALSMRERWPGEVEQAVAAAVSDVGVTFIPVATEGVEHVEVARVASCIAARRGAFEDAPLEQLPFVVPSHPITGAVASHGPLDGWPVDVRRDVRYRVSSAEARLDLAAQGVAVAVVPEFALARYNRGRTPAHRLVALPAPRRVGSLRRGVFLASRSTAAPELARRIAAVHAGVAALCDA